MDKISLPQGGLAFIGVVAGIILVILRETEKMKNTTTLVILLGIAASLTLPLALGNSWVRYAPSLILKFARGGVSVCVVGLVFFGLAAWIFVPPPIHGVPYGMTLQPPLEEVRLEFKDSPLLDENTKSRIKHDITEFRNYLVRLGIPVPIGLLPMGTRKKTDEREMSGTGFATPLGSQCYEGKMIITEDLVQDKTQATALYCSFALFKFFCNERSPVASILRRASVRELAEIQILVGWICSYLNGSFWNEESLHSSFLLASLWEVRKKWGKEFADRMLGYTFTAMMDYPAKSNESINGYFLDKLKIGESVKDNDDGVRWPEIMEMLQKHGFSH